MGNSGSSVLIDKNQYRELNTKGRNSDLYGRKTTLYEDIKNKQLVILVQKTEPDSKRLVSMEN